MQGRVVMEGIPKEGWKLVSDVDHEQHVTLLVVMEGIPKEGWKHGVPEAVHHHTSPRGNGRNP